MMVPSRRRGKPVLLASLLFALLAISAWAEPPHPIKGEPTLTVMTRNLYLGADLLPVVLAETQEEFFAAAQAALQQIAATNFPERAQALAAEIADRRPHLVGVQEVFNFTLEGRNGPPPFRDYLEDLLAALADLGTYYYVAATVQDMSLAVPVPGIGTVGVTDRDVILARSDVPTAVLPLKLTGCRESRDGCNFTVVASVDSPAGPIIIERGFVGVIAFMDGQVFRVVNTHLEERTPDPRNPLSPVVQALQAYELLALVGAFPNTSGDPVILVGDFNSSVEDRVITVDSVTIVPPYIQVLAAGYADAWTLRPGNPPGLTCCEQADLLNRRPILTERIDLVLSGPAPARVKANVVGNEPSDKTTPSRLWPSDHSGVVARLWFQ